MSSPNGHFRRTLSERFDAERLDALGAFHQPLLVGALKPQGVILAWMKKVRYVFFVLLVGFLLFDLIIIIPPVRSAALWASGRSTCSFQDGLYAKQFTESLAKSGSEIEKSTRVVRHESGIKLIETRSGRYWVPEKDRLTSIILAEQEHDVYRTDETVRPGDTVLDVGANIGAFTEAALRRGAAVSVAVEPVPETLEALRRNLARPIQERRVIVYAKGVWDKPGALPMQLFDNNAGMSSLVFPSGDRTITVPLVTIDELVDELKLTRVDVIKMDIEGAEKPALRGAAATIRRFHPRLVISVEHLPDDTTAIPAMIRSIAAYVVEPCYCQDMTTSLKAFAMIFWPAN